MNSSGHPSGHRPVVRSSLVTKLMWGSLLADRAALFQETKKGRRGVFDQLETSQHPEDGKMRIWWARSHLGRLPVYPATQPPSPQKAESLFCGTFTHCLSDQEALLRICWAGCQVAYQLTIMKIDHTYVHKHVLPNILRNDIVKIN